MKAARLLTSLVLSIFCAFAHADLRLDKASPKTPADIDSALAFYAKNLSPFVKQNTFSFPSNSGEPYKPNAGIGGVNSIFKWSLNGVVYTSAIASFAVDNDMIPECKDYATKGNSLDWKGPSCDSINWRGKKCHLFMLNEANEIAGVGRVDIGRDMQLIKGKPFCFDVKAMTAPPEVPDAFLVTLGYIDSAWFPDPRNEPDQFLTTVLLRLKQEDNGKLTITHDTSCLDSTNRIANLGTARKRLRECAVYLGK
jgi:hypothetical protein